MMVTAGQPGVHMTYRTDDAPARLRAMFALPLAACLFAAATPPAQAARMCPPNCVTSVTVVGAAGVPDDVKNPLEGLSFQGTAVTAESAASLTRVASGMRAGGVLRLTVVADTGLSARAASAQVAERTASLSAALKKAGLRADQFTINAR